MVAPKKVIDRQKYGKLLARTLPTVIETDAEYEHFLAEIEKRNYELDPTPGENLEAIVKDVMSQPPAIIERLKMVLVAK